MIANITRSVSRLKRQHLAFKHPYLFMKLCIFRLKRFILGLKIRVLSFKCRLLGLNESKMLTQDRRRAMLVDKFFEMVKQSHSANL